MSAPEPYFSDGQVVLYLGDCREMLPALGLEADCIIADPPYGETSLDWDKWPDGWLKAVAPVSRSMWCFGSLRMYLEHGGEFTAAGWKLSQDIIWEKQAGTGLSTDRFRRVHEQPTHWYQGAWNAIYRDAPRERWYGTDNGQRSKGGSKGAHLGEARTRRYDDDGTRLMKSVIRADNLHQRAIHKTQKPGALLEPMITYACPPGGLLVDPSSGSGAALMIAKQTGRRAVGIELHEPHAEESARWLSQATLFGEAS